MPLTSSIADIVDISVAQKLMEHLWEVTAIPNSLLGKDGTILVATGWQPICAEFHRKHPKTASRCRESDRYLAEDLKAGNPLPQSGYVEYLCSNGMIDVEIPIVIDDTHLGSLVLGQFFYYPPDEEFFRDQARECRFDETAYLKALRAVPILAPEKVFSLVKLHINMVGFLCLMAMERQNHLYALQSLKKSERNFRAFFEKTDAGMAIIDRDGTLTRGNPALYRYLGYSEEEIVGQPALSITHPEDRPSVGRLYQAGKKQTPGFNYENRYLRKDGSVVWGHTTAAPLFNEKNRITSFVALVQDLTTRKAAEEALRESERRTSTLMANLPGIAYRCRNDRQRTMEFVSDGCRELTGYPPQDLAGNRRISFGEIIHPEDRPQVRIDIETALAVKKPFRIEYRILTAASEERWVWERGRGIDDQQGNLQAIEGFISDISERKEAAEKLRKSEERLSLALKASNVGVWDWNLATGEVLFSPGYFTMLGYQPGELPASFDTWINLLHPEDRNDVLPQIEQLVETGESFQLEFRLIGRNGRPVQILSRGESVEFDDQGRPTRMIGTHMDITERLEARKVIEKNRARLAEAQRIARMGSWEADLASGSMFWSEELYRLLGQNPERFVPTTDKFFALVHPEDRTALQKAFARAVSGGKDYHLEHRVVLSDGNVRYFDLQGRVKSDGSGLPVRIVGTSLDITERKRAEDGFRLALREAEESRDQIDTLIKSVADGLVVTDHESRVTLLNLAAEKLSSVSGPEALLQPIEAMFTPAQLGLQVRSALRGLEGPLSSDLEMIEPHSGRRLSLQARTAAVRNRQGEVSGTITILRDITRERELDQMKNEFISTAAHELRTPLTSILGFSEILLDPENYGPLEPQQQNALLQSVHNKARRLQGIVSDLFDLSRVQSGQTISLQRTTIDICDYLQKHLNDYRNLLRSHRIEYSLPDSPVNLSADGAKLEQVLDNLLTNAVKFSSPESRLFISARLEKGSFEVSVVDEGIGMTEEQVEKVFDKFYRVDSSDCGKPGLGLGMSIAQSIIEAHGGEIRVQSTSGEGTTVTFNLPVHGPTHHKKLLVVDDQPDIRSLVQVVLCSANRQLLSAESGEEAIEIARAEKPDLILLDVMMPGGMDGYEVARQLRERPETCRCKILFMTAKVQERDRTKAFHAGGDDFIGKPFDLALLQEKVDNLLASR